MNIYIRADRDVPTLCEEHQLLLGTDIHTHTHTHKAVFKALISKDGAVVM